MHGLVVAASLGWPVETDPCVARHDPVVRLVADSRHPRAVNCPRLGPGEQAASVLLAGPLRDPALPRLRDLPERVTVHGPDVRTSPVSCLVGEPTTCSAAVAVPPARVAFAVTMRGRATQGVVRALRASLREMPDGATTVPPLELGTPVGAAAERPEAPGGARAARLLARRRLPALRHRVAPGAGAVVPTGSTVGLTVGDG